MKINVSLGQGSLNRWKDEEVRGHLTYLANRCCLSPTSKAVFLRTGYDFDEHDTTYQFGNTGVRYVKHPHVRSQVYKAKMRQFEQDALNARLGDLPRCKVRRCLPRYQESLYERRLSFHHPTRGLVAVLEDKHVMVYLKLSRSLEDEMTFFPSVYRRNAENFDLYNAPLSIHLNCARSASRSPDFFSQYSSSSDEEKDNSLEEASIAEPMFLPSASQ